MEWAANERAGSIVEANWVVLAQDQGTKTPWPSLDSVSQGSVSILTGGGLIREDFETIALDKMVS